MGYVSQIAGLYAAVFLIGLVWWNWWLSTAMSLLGVFLVVVLALMIDNIDESKAEEKWAKEKVSELEEKTRHLDMRLKEHEEIKGKVELL